MVDLFGRTLRAEVARLGQRGKIRVVLVPPRGRRLGLIHQPRRRVAGVLHDRVAGEHRLAPRGEVVFVVHVAGHAVRQPGGTQGAQPLVQVGAGFTKVRVTAVAHRADAEGHPFQLRRIVGQQLLGELHRVVRRVALAKRAAHHQQVLHFRQRVKVKRVERANRRVIARRDPALAQLLTQRFRRARLRPVKDRQRRRVGIGARVGAGLGFVRINDGRQPGEIAVDPLTLGGVEGSVVG